MPNKRRLLWQLFCSYLLIALISLLAVSWYATATLRDALLKQIASDLEIRALLFEAQIVRFLEPLDQKEIDSFCKKVGPPASTRVTVILSSGEVVGDSHEDPVKMDNHRDRPEVRAALAGQPKGIRRHSLTMEQNLMYVAVPIRQGDRTLAVVRTSIPLDDIDRAVKGIKIKIILSSLLIAAFAAVLSFLLSHRIRRPIEESKEVAERFARGDFHRRLPVFARNEIGGLSESLNRMAEELQERIQTITTQRNELEAVLTSMMEGVLAVDMEEKIISMNRAAAQTFDCDPADMQGRTIQEVLRHPDLQRFVRHSLTSEEPVEKDIVLRSEQDRILWGMGTPLRDGGKRRIGALIVLNDVTRLRKLENIRRDFVANVSHEIKTPITAIKGFVETLREGAVDNPEDAQRFLSIVQKHADRLEAIVEDLLSLSRVEKEAEKEGIVLEEHAVRDVLAGAVQVCGLKASSKNIHLELSCEEDLKARMNAALLEQAVVNLIDNAIKYSDPGKSVLIEGKKREKEILIRVQDYGCGIEKGHLDRLFERFYRVDKARSRKLGGTGLGLAIVKHIMQAHGGSVSVESQPGKGSTFTLLLPDGSVKHAPSTNNLTQI